MGLSEVIKDLLENGVHFGHLSKHWNPKMSKFIFGKKKNIYIIDLEKTVQKLDEAKEFARKIVQDGGIILFVGTKKQLRDCIKEQAIGCDMPYVAERWVGGFLTNFSTIKTRIKKYMELLEKKQKGEFDKMPGKEVARLNRQLGKMEKSYSGVVSLEDLPQCIYIVDPKREIACVQEAIRLSIPIIGLIDTDADPTIIDYPVPGNDDAIKSVRCITTYLAEAIKDCRKQLEAVAKEAKKLVEEKTEKEEQKPIVAENIILEEEIAEGKDKPKSRSQRKKIE